MKTLHLVCMLLMVLGLNPTTQTDARITIAVVWSPGRETLAVGGSTREQGAIWLYDDLGTAIDTIYVPGTVVSVSWSRDGTRLAARYEVEWGTRLAIWDWESFKLDTPSVTTDEIRGPSAGYRIAWSPTGHYIAADDGLSVHIIATAAGSQVAKLYDEERTGTSGTVALSGQRMSSPSTCYMAAEMPTNSCSGTLAQPR